MQTVYIAGQAVFIYIKPVAMFAVWTNTTLLKW